MRQKGQGGLEISGIAAVDTRLNTAFHLEAIQTDLSESRDKNLLAHYLGVIKEREDDLLEASRHMSLDAYFSRVSFVDGVVGLGLYF